jgi:hypothetical protein
MPRLGFSIELNQHKHAADGVTISIGRGITLFDKELESARTEEISLGIQLIPDVLHLSVPFSNYEVDTRGGIDDALPIGAINVNTVGLALTLAIPGRWSPFVGVGSNFYSFDERFGTPANIQNMFGVGGYGGLRIRLIEKIFDVVELHGAIVYQFGLLKPDISVPNKPEIGDLSLNRHSVMFRLELTGL